MLPQKLCHYNSGGSLKHAALKTHLIEFTPHVSYKARQSLLGRRTRHVARASAARLFFQGPHIGHVAPALVHLLLLVRQTQTQPSALAAPSVCALFVKLKYIKFVCFLWGNCAFLHFVVSLSRQFLKKCSLSVQCLFKHAIFSSWLQMARSIHLQWWRDARAPLGVWCCRAALPMWQPLAQVVGQHVHAASTWRVPPLVRAESARLLPLHPWRSLPAQSPRRTVSKVRRDTTVFSLRT